MGFLSPIIQIILGLLGLSFLVFIHELGHFLMAKKYGVKVKVFSIGFGKKLISFRKGDTEYCLSLIPFGGYVAMAGESPDDQGTDDPGSFVRQPIRARAMIAFGGPAINIIFAFLTLFVLYMVGVNEPLRDKLVVGLVEKESPAAVAGINPGDTIISVAGKSAQGWDKFREEVGISLGASVKMQVKNQNGEEREVQMVPKELKDLGIGWVGLHPLQRVIVATEPAAESPAAQAGFQKGDTIMSVQGILVTSHIDVLTPVNASEGNPMTFQVLRGGDTLTKIVAAKFNKEEERYLVGIQMGLVAMREAQFVRRGPLDAAVKSVSTSYNLATSIFRYLGRMAKGQVKAKALSGPPGIVAIIGLSWLESFQSLMMMLALISVNLGVMNLLPLAITDGGILMFLALEWVRGKPLSIKTQTLIQQVAASLFIFLFIYLTFQDLSRFSLFLR